ncbi:MAG: acyloxyacyl hydrolase [Verrucomicrobiales bacterium]
MNDDLEQLIAAEGGSAGPDEFDLLDSWAFDIDVGSIWNVGNNTPLDYQIIPAILSLRTPSHWVWDLANGASLAVRTRVNALVEAIVEGPENHYFGMSASPSIEYWFPRKRTYLHFAIGGGAGYIDSQGVYGGQGQDFTWNWFMHGGVRHFVTEKVAVSLGVYFQHNSNRGATDPNPGIDAVGPLVGLSWHF